MLKRLLSLVLTTIMIISVFTAISVSVNAEEVPVLTDSTDTYSQTEDDSAESVSTEPATESESEKETEPNTELPSVAPITTEAPTEHNEDSFNTVEIQTKPELASTGTTSETYEQAARYVPNYVITGTNTIQPMYNPYTVQMLLDMSLSAYEISKSDDWSYALVTHSYSQVYRVENNAVYGISESTNILNIIDQNYFSSLNATVGLKRVEYNGQTKYAIAIAFRGTNTKDIADLVDDISAFPNFNGIHKGFADNANNFYNLTPNIVFSIDGNNISLYDMIQDMKNEDSPYCMLVTGHSLGGATADVFVGCNLYSAGVKPSKVLAYTFAAPKSAYYNSYPFKNIINIINEDDVVPTLGASENIGTNISYTPDDSFRQAHYGEKYQSGHGTAWWSSLVNEVPHFISHDLEEVYQSIINDIEENTDNYISYHTNGDIIWQSLVTLDKNSYGTFAGCVDANSISFFGGKLTTNGSLNVNKINAGEGGGIISCDVTVNSELKVDYNALLVEGDLNSKNSTYIYGSGRIEVTGNCTMYSLVFNSDGYLLIHGNFIKTGGGYCNQLSDGTVEIKGDFDMGEYLSYFTGNNHKVILSGDKTQHVKSNSISNTLTYLIIDNTGSEVIFDSPIKITKLFNHKGNNFILYNYGVGSTFVDYDGDGMLDHVDPYPTDPNNSPHVKEKRGDSDGDGEVTILDATHIQRYLAAFDVPNFNEVTADADNDGSITILDATAIQRYLAAFENIHNIGRTIE